MLSPSARSFRGLFLLPLVAVIAVGCEDIGSNEENATQALKEGSPEALSVLAMVNDPAIDAAALDHELA